MDDRITTFLNTHFAEIDRCTPYSDALRDEFLRLGPLHYCIPKAAGGRFDGYAALLEVVDATSYASLPMGLMLGITGSLFLRPLIVHALPSVAGPVIESFLSSATLGGMMITEPTGGTDIFGLQTGYIKEGGELIISGSKCWAGLTGQAQHWLVAARAQRGDTLTKRINLLYVSADSEGFAVEETFDALGLQPIGYGRTRYDAVRIPEAQLVARKGQSGLRMIYDTLFRSRLGMPAIASGHCRRLYEESLQRAQHRHAFGVALTAYDQIQARLGDLAGMSALNRRLWAFTADWMDRHDDVSGDYTLVNACKTICSETMQLAADSAVQLFASAAYKRNHGVGRAYVDCRPFPIFEGVNDVLHDNSHEIMVARYGGCTLDGLEAELERYGLPLSPAIPPSALACFTKDSPTRLQRQSVQMGRIMSWIFALGILDSSSIPEGEGVDQARRMLTRRLAALAAEMDYL